ncbi:isoprenoid biosynthesis glyoxalase ElbB [Pseudomonas sp. BN414]|uniref:isoprenoid biosynthesis glyoxalase ElbB n=1 Tax=Pseudomonas sp. BN414 TaxID=2567888 RepID=UPI0024581A07|nr:isoprenoid biosynthesis glyoxalase ElbB [Pseudomonas sp. BN414]MDH4570410.1 isoprenoid biosynthesis glyoxalase ElbB [Pseudomonas sp. BN414]
MTKKVAVILSGCGVYDGAEIHESVITLLRLDQRGAKVQCFAPNIAQHHVIDHTTGEEMPESRNVLVESARIARGEIKDVRELKADDFDALIVPGGFGAAKNLSDFAVSGANYTVQPDVLAAARDFAEAGKPVGLICIAPALAAKIYGEGVTCTIGNDAGTAAALGEMGAQHVECVVGEIVEDVKRKLVTTPAYMLAQSISEAAGGIYKLVDRVLELTH